MRLGQGALLALLALTALRLVLAAQLPLAPDEAYYFLWARHLQPGYFDHPPMVALWIRAGISLAGPTPLGIRLFGPVSAALGSLLIYRAMLNFFDRPKAGLAAAAALNATLMVGVGAIIMTPDTPLLFFWTAGIAAISEFLAQGDRRWWLGIGLAAGGALLSKYTGLLFVAAVFLWLAGHAQGRAVLRGPWPWLGLLLALAVFTPDIYWNAQNGWVSYLKQGSRVTGFDAARSAQFLVEFLVSQIGLATPLIFGLAAYGLARLSSGPDPGARLLVWLTLVPGVVFLEHVVSGRVQSNWPAVMYPSACLAAAALPGPSLRRWLRPALGLGFGMTALAYVQALAAPFPLPARMDPTALQFAGFAPLAAAVAAEKPAFVTSDEYAGAAMLAFYAPPGLRVAVFPTPDAPRWDYFGFLSAGLKGRTGIMVTKRTDTYCPVVLGEFVRKRGASPIATYKFCRFVAFTPGLELPRP